MSRHAVELETGIGKLLLVRRDQLVPLPVRLPAPAAELGLKVLAHTIGNQELGVGIPAVELLGQADLVGAERLAVGFLGILPVGSAVADVAVHDDQRGPVAGGEEGVERVGQQVEIVDVAHPEHVPPISQEPAGDILGEGDEVEPSMLIRLLS